MEIITAQEAIKLTKEAPKKDLNMEAINDFLQEHYVFDCIKNRAMAGLDFATIQSEDFETEFSIAINVAAYLERNGYSVSLEPVYIPNPRMHGFYMYIS